MKSMQVIENNMITIVNYKYLKFIIQKVPKNTNLVINVISFGWKYLDVTIKVL